MKIGEFYKKTLKLHGNSQYLSEIVLRSIIVSIEKLDNMSSFFLMLDKELRFGAEINEAILRVLSGEPYQYVLKEAYFYGESFYVDNNVLIPRMETEELVQMVLNDYADCINKLIIADVGTGSGCIAIILKKNILNSDVFASDISQSAIAVASINATQHNININFLEGDLLTPFIQRGLKLDIIISNPPYIKKVDDVESNVFDYEPHVALFAKDGIDFYVKIFKDVHKVLNSGGTMYFEINYDQKEALTNEVIKYFPNSKFEFYKDAFGLWRKLKIVYKE